MRYRIVQRINDQFTVSETDDIRAWAQVRGVAIVKLNNKPWQRAELQGEPILATFCGPMWDGGAIRYEDQAANDFLSV